MSDKLVYVKELKQGRSDKTNSTWPEITDQDNEIWRLFRQQIQVELGKAYLITFNKNEKGFNDIEKITPLVNIFKQEALKEVASKNDIKRDLNVALSYAKDLVIGDKIPLADIERQTLRFYDFLTSETDKVMASIQTPKQEIK